MGWVFSFGGSWIVYYLFCLDELLHCAILFEIIWTTQTLTLDSLVGIFSLRLVNGFQQLATIPIIRKATTQMDISKSTTSMVLDKIKMKKSYYDIQFYMEPPVDKWSRVMGFCDMQKSFAEGAWAMLKSFSNQRYKHRLLKDGVVVEEMSKQTIRVN